MSELKTYVCPNCGASTTNARNCEYCGSLLVRFVEKGIDISNTPYIDNSFVFPGLIEALEKNIEYQKERKCCVTTSILYQDKLGWNVGYFSGIHIGTDEDDLEEENEPNLYISKSFDICNNSQYAESNKINELMISRLSLLKSFPLFEKYEYEADGELVGGGKKITYEYGIDMGQDAEGAARLISEIIMKVDEICITDPVFVYTYYDNDEGDAAYTKAFNNWCRAHGLESEIHDEQEQNKEEPNVPKLAEELDMEDKKLDGGKLLFSILWGNLIVFLLLIPGLCGYTLFLFISLIMAIAIYSFFKGFINKRYYWPVAIGSCLLIVILFFSVINFDSSYEENTEIKREQVENCNQGNKAETVEQNVQQEKENKQKTILDNAYVSGVNDAREPEFIENAKALIQAGYSKDKIETMQKQQGRLNYKKEYGEPKNSEEESLMNLYGEKYAEGFMKTLFKN